MKMCIALYKNICRIEVLTMKKLSELPVDLAEKLELPAEIVPGTGTVTVSGGKQALVEGHRGVIAYSEERLVVALGRGKINISGSGLKLRAMSSAQLMISGRIQGLEWE